MSVQRNIAILGGGPGNQDLRRWFDLTHLYRRPYFGQNTPAKGNQL
jgi:hypothetical protein